MKTRHNSKGMYFLLMIFYVAMTAIMFVLGMLSNSGKMYTVFLYVVAGLWLLMAYREYHAWQLDRDRFENPVYMDDLATSGGSRIGKNKKRKQRKTARLPLKSAQANIRQVLRSIFMSHSSADGLLQNRQPDVLLIPTAGIMVLSSAIRPTEKSKLASLTNHGICAMSAFPIPRSSWTNI